jgi:ABC-type antimicrobial peptide transport system permease subunit
MSVLERTREFGIIMALGLKPVRLGGLVLLETALMAGLGLALGVLLGGLLTLWVGQVGFAYPGMEEMAGKFNLAGRMYPQINGITLLLGPMTVFVACMVAALYPAARLHFMQPVQAMRSV